jgi:hypothetical protein
MAGDLYFFGRDRRTLEVRKNPRKREFSLESLEEYEVAERPPEADLDAAETTLAHLLVESWLRAKPDPLLEVKARDLTQDNAILRKDENAA